MTDSIEDNTATAPHPTRKTQQLRQRLFLVVPVVAVIIGLYYFAASGRYVSTDNAYIKSNVASITAEINGRIVDILVRENESVKAGDLLIRIDPRSFQIEMDDAAAGLQQAYIEINALKSEYVKKAAALAAAEDDLAFAIKQQKRILELFERGMTSGVSRDQAQRDLDVARNTVAELTSERSETLAQLGGIPDPDADKHPRVLQAKALLEKAKLNLEHCELRAPIDGVVSNVPQMGEYALPGLPLISVVADKEFWVEANFKEDQLAKLRTGAKVNVEVDAYNGEVWQATVQGIAQATDAEFSLLPAQNSSGNWVKVVQRVPVRLDIQHHDNESPLRAGLSAVVSVDTGVSSSMKALYDLLGLE